MRELARVEHRDATLVIVGRLPDLPSHLPLPNDSRVAVSGEGPVRVLTWEPGTSEPIERAPAAVHPPLLFENEQYDLYLESPGDAELVGYHPGLIEHVRRTKHGTSAQTRHYRLKLRNDVGLVAFAVKSGASRLYEIELEVFPKKVDFRSDYVAMVDDVTAISHSLVFDVLGRTSFAAALAPEPAASMGEWYAILRNLFGELLVTVDAIAVDPTRSLESYQTWVRPEFASRVTSRGVRDSLRRPGNLDRNSRGFAIALPDGTSVSPRRLPEREHISVYDTPENRYLKWLLLGILARLSQARSVLLTEGRSAEESGSGQMARLLAMDASGYMSSLQRRLAYDFLRSAGTAVTGKQSSKMEAHPLYSKAFRLGQDLLRGLHVDTADSARIGSKPIWLLYEYWCYLAIVTLIREDADLIQTTAVQVDFQGSRVALTRGTEAAVEFEHRTSGKRLRVIYNRLYPTPTTWQKPDNVVHIESRDGIHVFDAKYRIQFDSDYVATYGAPGPTIEDINTMHRYKDAIVNPALKTYPRLVRSACILFPGPPGEDYRGHRFFKSIEDVGVGGLPFLPSQKEYVRERLRKVIQDAIA